MYISLVKKLTAQQLKVELESLHKSKFYPSVLLLMIKMNQLARKKLDSYCKKVTEDC